MNQPIIVNAVRTAIGNFGGSLHTVKANDLAATVLNGLVERSGIRPEQVDMVIMGQNYQSGEYVNAARNSLLSAGWPVEVPGGKRHSVTRAPSPSLSTVAIAVVTIV